MKKKVNKWILNYVGENFSKKKNVKIIDSLVEIFVVLMERFCWNKRRSYY